jgi:hypothetical protein
MQVMKQFLFCLIWIPIAVIAQKKENSFDLLLNHNWRLVAATNLEEVNDTVFSRERKIKRWDLEKFSIYRLDNGQIGFMDGTGLVFPGKPDSISSNRFIAYIRYENGYPCVYEFSNVEVTKNRLSYTFRKWNYKGSDTTKERLLHFGFHAVCQLSKLQNERPTWSQIEKSRGNKISYVFTTDNGQPVAGKEVRIIIHLKGMNVLQSVYTNSKGEATGYYPDSYFEINDHITMGMEYGTLSSSAVLEKKYCPVVLKRVLTSEKDDGIQIGRQE